MPAFFIILAELLELFLGQGLVGNQVKDSFPLARIEEGKDLPTSVFPAEVTAKMMSCPGQDMVFLEGLFLDGESSDRTFP